MTAALSADGVRAAQFLIRRMYRPVGFSDGAPYFAIAETEQAMGGDQWFWNDDNAKALEFLSLPEVAHRFPTEIAEILRFVCGMCRGPFIFRRSTQHLLEIVERVKRKGAHLNVLNLGMDTSTATGKLLLTMIGAIGQFEREMMLERQREGIAKARSEGKYKGEPPRHERRPSRRVRCGRRVLARRR